MRMASAAWVLGFCLAVGVSGLGQGAPVAARQPILISAPVPEYTDQARAKKISGNVLVHLTIGQDGLPKDVRVVRGIGYGLDEKAIEAVKQYRFKPAMRDGQAVETPINVEVNFQVF